MSFDILVTYAKILMKTNNELQAEGGARLLMAMRVTEPNGVKFSDLANACNVKVEEFVASIDRTIENRVS